MNKSGLYVTINNGFLSRCQETQKRHSHVPRVDSHIYDN